MKHCFRQLPSRGGGGWGGGRGQVSLFLQLHKSLGVVDVASTIMLFYYVGDVLHTTITQFQSIRIEDFV